MRIFLHHIFHTIRKVLHTCNFLLALFDGSTKYILNNIHLQVEKGKSVAIIGVSGAGKRTLGNLILGLLVPDDGKILLNDEKIEGSSGRG